MKKLLCFIPAIIFTSLYGSVLLAGFELELIAYVFWGLLLISGLILCFKKWWGIVTGVIMGMWLILLDLSAEGPQIISQWPIGLVIILYYLAFAFFSFRKRIR